MTATPSAAGTAHPAAAPGRRDGGALTAGGTSMVCGCESADCRKRFRRRAGPDRDPRDGRGRHGERHRRCPVLPGHGAIPADQVASSRTRAAAPMRTPAGIQAGPNTDPRPHWRCPGTGPMLPVPQLSGCSPRRSAISTTHFGRAGQPHPSTWLPSSSSPQNLPVRRKGWREEQFTDGTIVWTSPSGRTYTLPPRRASLMLPGRSPADTSPPAAWWSPGAALMMPTRRRPRAARQARPYPLGARPQRGPNERRPPPFLARRR